MLQHVRSYYTTLYSMLLEAGLVLRVVDDHIELPKTAQLAESIKQDKDFLEADGTGTPRACRKNRPAGSQLAIQLLPVTHSSDDSQG